LAVIAGWTDTGRTSDAKVIYILSNVVHCIGQTTRIYGKRGSASQKRGSVDEALREAVAALAIDKVGPRALPFSFGPYLGPYHSARKPKK